jgi:hypothetical protein
LRRERWAAGFNQAPWRQAGAVALLAIMTGPVAAAAQTLQGATGRVSFHVNTATHQAPGEVSWSDNELWTGVDLRSRESESPGVEFGVDFRHSGYPGGSRPQRVSLYDGFAGVRLGSREQQVRVRAGHMWLPELGSIGALAGGLAEWRRSVGRDAPVFRVGGFGGLEPQLYTTGYESGVRKVGGYVALEKGFLQRHLVGYTLIRQGATTERSVVSLSNFVPVGRAFFLYQAAELDVQGPAGGTASPGLSYFMANARASAGKRVELLGTYNRGRALDARTLTDDVQNGRLLTPQAIDGLRYESAGGRVTVEVLSQVHVYTGYSRDRNNRDDAPSDRLTLGAHGANVFGSGVDVSASADRIQRPTGPYHSTYVSVGRNIGRDIYVSVDYSTSLAIVRFPGADGLLIETRPSTRRVSGSASSTIVRNVSLLCTVDYTRDDAADEVRLLAGLSYRLR